jgi:hypothetical protein
MERLEEILHSLAKSGLGINTVVVIAQRRIICMDIAQC